LLFGAIFARYITKVPQHTVWNIYFLLTSLHIYANVRCMRLIKFNYLNRARMDILMSRFFQQQHAFPFKAAEMVDNQKDSTLSNTTTSFHIDTPDQVSRVEPLLFMPRCFSYHKNAAPVVKIGVPFNDFVQYSCYPLQLTQSIQRITRNGTFKEAYLVSPGFCRKSNAFCVLAVVVHGATKLDMTKAYFHASMYAHIMRKNHITNCKSRLSVEEQFSRLRLVDEEVYKIIEDCWSSFKKQVSAAGWDLAKSDVVSEGYQIQFNPYK
jgi:hypothetical protein